MKLLLTYGLIFNILLSSFPLYAQNQRELTQEEDETKPQKRTALVIGNAEYTSARKLANPSNDATDMANSLKALGFEVVSGTNLNLKQMNDKVREFGDKLKANGGVGLFYYAGHGIQVSGRNYLIPVDAEIPREDEVDFNALNLDQVLRKMATANNGLNIVILDACRNNPFARSWSRDTSDGGLAQISAPTGTFIAYATSPDRTASDGTGRNGLYTGELLKAMKQPNVKIEDAFKQVTIAVDRTSGGKQVPWTSSSLRGEFYFSGGSVVEKTPVSTETSSNNVKNGETLFWQSIENSTDFKDFENYLFRIERGDFAGAYKAVAELKILKLKKSVSAANFLKRKLVFKSLLKYTEIGRISDGLASAQIGTGENVKVGFLDKNGREVIAPKFDCLNCYAAFSEGLAPVSIDETWGFIDKTGKLVIENKYDDVKRFSEGLAAVKLDEKWGFIDKNGELVIPLKYEEAEDFSEEMASVQLNGKWGMINSSDSVLIPFEYKEWIYFAEGLAMVRKETNGVTSKWGFIDRSGEVKIPFQFGTAFNFREGLAAVAFGDIETGKQGYIDKQGNTVFKTDFDVVFPFFEGFARVKKGFAEYEMKNGFIDRTGRTVVPLKYSEAAPFINGIAKVSVKIGTKFKYGAINKSGYEVIPPKFDDLWCSLFEEEGYFGVIFNGKKGFVDIYGNEYFDF